MRNISVTFYSILKARLMVLLFLIAGVTVTNAQVYDGSLNLSNQTMIDTFHYTSVTGGIRIDDSGNPGSIKNLHGLSELTSIGNNLVMFWTDSLPNLEGLNNLTHIGGWLGVRFTSIQDLSALSNLTSVKSIWIDANARLTDLDGFTGITTVDTLWITWNSVTNLDGLSNITGQVHDLSVFRNNLTNIDGLLGITGVTDSVWIGYEPLQDIEGLSNITSVGGGIEISHLNDLRSFCGIYPVLSNGFSGGFTAEANSYNPTVQEIINCGPCSGINAPTAVLTGPTAKTVITGKPITLDINGSTDPDNDPLSALWKLYWPPSQSSAVLTDSTSLEIIFTPDISGYYNFFVSAFDGCAVSARVFFSVRAITVEEAAEELSADIQNLNLNGGNKNALTSKLQNAVEKYKSGDLKAAKNILLAFLNQLNQFVLDGSVTPAEAQPIIDYVNSLIESIDSELSKQYAEVETQLPQEFELKQNYPNPFNPSTTISWQMPEQSRVSLKVYDVLGTEVAVLIDGDKAPGYYEVTFDASSLASGMYYYRLEAGNYVMTRKMMLLK